MVTVVRSVALVGFFAVCIACGDQAKAHCAESESPAAWAARDRASRSRR